MSKKKLFQVLFAILLAIIAGHMTGTESTLFGIKIYKIYNLLGQLFINALMLVVVPLVTASIITGTARMGKDQSFGKLGAKTFCTFLGTTALAILIGWGLAVWIEPGVFQKGVAIANSKALEIAANVGGDGFDKVEAILLQLVPSNIFAVAAKGQMLGLILFSFLFGYFITKIGDESGRILLGFWQGLFEVMMKITELVMKAMPIGVFGLVAKVVATTGLESITTVGLFIVTVIAGLLIYMLLALGALLKSVAKVHPVLHLKAMAPALLTAFTTSSSVATLPLAIECVEKRSGVSNRITSFILPIGTSLNLAGSSLQVIVSVFFIAQSYGVELSFSTQALIFFMTWLLSIGVAGIPSASLISIVIILTTVGFPAEGIGLIMAVERILDMCRTTVNIYSNSCCAVLIARSEGEKLLIS